MYIPAPKAYIHENLFFLSFYPPYIRSYWQGLYFRVSMMFSGSYMKLEPQGALIAHLSTMSTFVIS